MRFGSFPVKEAEGCVLAHSVRVAGGRLAKGRIVTADDIDAMAAEGIAHVTAVRLEPGDWMEDEAAAAIASAMSPANTRLSEAATGRVNFHATTNGLFMADRAMVDALNRIDPAITLATLADHAPVRKGDMVATVKIIPLAVGSAKVREAISLFGDMEGFAVRPFKPHRVTLIATQLPTLKPSVMDRTAQLLARRLEISESRLTDELRIDHDTERLAAALRETLEQPSDQPKMIVIFGASAVADADDVIPAAIRAAGGRVEHVGMPVDPGNLLVLGHVGDVPVLGAPGCARSPKENGFDWVLNRILAGERVSAFDITGMGVGGLLTEIRERPRPRDMRKDTPSPLSVGALLLAAGQARRMGADGSHKLLARFGGVPLVRRSAATLVEAGVTPRVAVTGHRHVEIEEALAGIDVTSAHNADYASGMAGSLVLGLSRPEIAACDGVLIMLADMPAVTAEHIRRLVDAFNTAQGEAVVRAVDNGKRGNPIILPRATFDAVRSLQGDVGARAVVENSGLPIIDVEIGPAAHLDVDTPEAVIAAGGMLGD